MRRKNGGKVKESESENRIHKESQENESNKEKYQN